MRKYEFIYILEGTLDESAVNQSLEKYLKIIRDQGSEVIHHEVWGRRKFAYEIDRKTEGTYLFIRMKASPEAVKELNRVLSFDENVLRKLIVLDEEWERRNAEANARREAGSSSRPSTAPASAS